MSPLPCAITLLCEQPFDGLGRAYRCDACDEPTRLEPGPVMTVGDRTRLICDPCAAARDAELASRMWRIRNELVKPRFGVRADQATVEFEPPQERRVRRWIRENVL